MQPRRLKSLSEIWPRGADALVEHLKKAGFQAAVTKPAEGDSWSRLREARPASTVGSLSGYGYVETKTPAPKGEWGLLFTNKNRKESVEASCIITTDFPGAAMDFVLNRASPATWTGPSAPIPAGIYTEENVHLGPECEIGPGTRLESGVRIGARVHIGRDCFIGANSRIADDTIIGDHCHFAGPVAIGGPGFGLLKYPGAQHYQQRTHAGRVVIGDHVRLGSFVSIDRGVFDDTTVGANTLVDNLVQIGHNCRVGEGSVLCGLVGLAGSTTLGRNVVLAGQVGIGGHVTLGDGVSAGGQCGITTDIPAGITVTGTPWRPIAEESRIRVLLGKLPEMYKTLRKLEEKL